MKLWTPVALVLTLVPVIASAQYKDMDSAMASLSRGFERGDSQPIIAGIADGDQVRLQFPGLVKDSGFLGRDQASYLLDELFNKTKPSGFQQVSVRKVSSEEQYHITASWTIDNGNGAESRDLYITLAKKNDRWAVAVIRSTGK